MAIRTNVHEAKTRLSEAPDRVQRGEEVIIAKAGKPCARLVPIYPKGERNAGAFRGVIIGDPLGPVGSHDEDWG